MSTAVTATVAAVQRLLVALNGIDLSDDRGVEDSPAKMIWIGAAIVIAIAATAFAVNIFQDAQGQVPQPAVPQGG